MDGSRVSNRQRPTAQGVTPWRRRPESMAAAVNGALIVLVPTVVAASAIYTSTAVRPSPPTLISSVVAALPVTLGCSPVSLLVAWRTYVHAGAYRLNRLTAWHGPAESAAIGGAIALMLMVPATAATWAREPVHLVIAYIAFYVGSAALAGLALGIVLAATAVLVLRLWT
jgi:hypothetical protein